jgi:outer membrane lipoprotein-sorting protein
MADRNQTPKAAAAALALVISLGAAPAHAATGEALLRQAITADDHVSYTGTVTTVLYGGKGADSTIVRIDHAAPKKWRMWYVAPADAYGRLILSNESLTYQYEPKTATVYSNSWAAMSPGVDLDVDAATVLSNYKADVGPATSIAGRKATELSLVSKFSGVLAERLWVDAGTNVVLRRETYHGDGTVDTRSGFETIRFVKDLPKELFDLTVPPGMQVKPGVVYPTPSKDVASVQSSVDFKVVSPQYLPDGFSLVGASLGTRNGIQNVQLVYTDGLRDFSIFENATGRLPQFDNAKSTTVDGESGITASLAGETLLSWNADSLNVTLVGDLSSRELAKIGASIKP